MLDSLHSTAPMRRFRFVLPLLIAACSSGVTGPDAPRLGITAQVDTVRPSGLLLVDITGGIARADTVFGTLGGRAVTLSRVDSTTLALLAPDVAPGSYSLRIDLAGDTLATPVTVLQGLTIADPTAEIRARLAASRSAWPVTAPAGIDSAQWARLRRNADSLIAATEAALASSSAEERLAVARMLAALLPAAPSAALTGSAAISAGKSPVLPPESAFFFKLSVCKQAKLRLIASTVVTIGAAAALKISWTAPVPPPYKLVGVPVTAAALALATVNTSLQLAEMLATCNIMSDLFADPADPFASGWRMGGTDATVVTPNRFFTGRDVPYFLSGNFRPVSKQELSTDADLKQASSLLDDISAAYGFIVSKVPQWVADLLPAAPARLSQMSPGAIRLRRVPATGVKIENVRPSTVQLTYSESDSSVRVRAGQTVTDDVPFTFDVVSTWDPTFKVTKSAVLRPMMSATVLAYPATVTGTRTTTTDANGNRVGTLSCGGSVTVRVKGGDQARWGAFRWTITGPGTLSGTDPLTQTPFESGDHPFSGSWYWAWSENGNAVFKPFTVTVTIDYTDLLTNTVKQVPAITFNCV